MKKHLLLSLIFVLLAIFILSASISISASDSGAKFSSQQHTMAKPLDFMPRTFDAVILLPTTHNDRGGVIMGSYGASSDCISFELYSNGVPRLYYTDSSGTVYNYLFNNVDVRSDNGPVRVTLVQDPVSKKITCYLNGEEKQSLDASDLPDEILIKKSQIVGGDHRSGNSQYFKGLIYSLNIYSDALSADQISSKVGTGLKVSYDFTAEKDHNIDLTGNGYDLYNKIQIANPDSLFETVEPEVDGGLSFDPSSQYITSNEGLSDTPYTYSAWIYLYENYTDRAGVIIGNYESGSVPCVSIEIYSSGAPRFYHIDSNNRVFDAAFTNVDVRKGEWVHLAFTVSDVVTCYLNGQNVGHRSIGTFDTAATDLPIAIGGDLRSGNAQNFKGKIREVTLFNEKLSDADISTIYSNGYNSLASKVIAHYDLENAVSGKNFEDKSGHGNTIFAKTKFFENKEPVKDFAYTFAFVGDTQVVTESYPDKLSKIYDWIISVKDSKKIEYVFGLGDITNSDTDKEWNTALTQISKLNDVIPYSLVRGNHDSTLKFNNFFNNNIYKNQFQGFYQDTINNSWRTFKAGKNKYLLITLDYGPDDNVLNWASNIIDNHPDYQVIITTHAYMFRDGTTLDDKDVWPPSSTGGFNDGDDIWEKLISKHENIVLVVSGHDPCDKIVTTQTKGEKGNIITQVLIDPQGVDAAVGATGMVALFHFSEDGSEIQIEYYSTVLEKYFLTENQFSLTLPISHIQSDDIDSSNAESIDDSNTTSQSLGEKDDINNFEAIILIVIIGFVLIVGIVVIFISKKKK